ncbi:MULTISPECIES: MarR family winged helix-turn-helix transcriptional regulator [Microbacterium]|uniref:MarR family transcriptional regulator n=1 Tax=Microbacterium wangchenii TaxID=2541726 RepID=A0ABX5SW43_9MICO|nr:MULTISPECIES: hypothetical protein [Microbacterium]MCK6066125.1 hypothetical protein [Microbacterium sp. EYE_512]QBR90405.1 hypothetical protein E4K62_17990 [Microbacterium wangchenii]TXK11579.1 hypothetical protein FVP99_14235 [Microbacterium wangchenii]
MDTPDTSPDSPPDRPLGFWLRTVDSLLDDAFAEVLAGDDLSRRDWMLLNAVDGHRTAPWLAQRLARRGGRVRRLAERGWIEETADGWALTDAGRDARERLATAVGGIRDRVAGAVDPEDFASMLTSLEAIARELGWDETRPVPAANPRRFGRRGGVRPDFGPGERSGRGFGPGERFERGFGPGERFERGFGPGARSGRGHGFEPHRHAGRMEHPCVDHRFWTDHDADTAFERGFTAGFTQGRAAASRPVA